MLQFRQSKQNLALQGMKTMREKTVATDTVELYSFYIAIKTMYVVIIFLVKLRYLTTTHSSFLQSTSNAHRE